MGIVVSRARLRVCALLPLCGLGGCVSTAPLSPGFTVLPRPDESFETFQQHDAQCRVDAERGLEPSPGVSTGVKSAVLGTGIGAASGALLGSVAGDAGAGAAIGAGGGMLIGSVIGSGQARQGRAERQRRYDAAYAQCMVGHGEVLPPPPPAFSSPRIYAAPAGAVPAAGASATRR